MIIERFLQVKNMGFVKSRRKSNTGIGKTFENYVGVVENNLDEPDLFGYEIKSHREEAASYITLFTKSPNFPPHANSYLKDRFGKPYEDNAGLKKLHTSMFASKFNKFGENLSFRLVNDKIRKIVKIGVYDAETKALIDDCAGYTYDCLDKVLKKKLKDLFYVTADRKFIGNDEYFFFNKAEVYSNPSIGKFLDLLDREEKSDVVNRYLETIKNRIEAMKRLTEELFQYSIVISAEYDLTMESLSINNVLEESILEFYGILQQQKITPNILITENKIVRKANRIALSRIFSNLMSNAIKYSDGDLEICLTDTGKIIFSNSASDLNDMEVERLFDRFYTVENARKSTGLGLSISRILIGKMNGEITAQYKNGRLSICVQLPEN